MGKDTSSDITKVGTAPLDGIRLEDLYSSYKSEAEALYRRASNSAAQAYRGDLGYEVFSNPGLFTPQESEFTLGQSVYDSPMMFAPTEEAISNRRADAQPWYLQLGAGLAKATSLAATTFLSGTVGLLYGIGAAATRGEWSGLWDNDFSKALKGWNDMMEEQLVNYYSTEELNGPWYKNILTSNFIGDKFIKNLGFTVGAFYGGGAMMAPLKLMGMGKNVGSAVHAVVSAVNEGSIEALNNSTDWYNLHKMQLDDSYQQGMAEALAEYEATRGILTGSMETGYKDEAYEKYKEKVAKLDQAYQSSLDRLELDRKRMGNADLLMNIPILTASNIVQFGKLMGRGFGKTKKVKDTLEETAKRRNAGALTDSRGVKVKEDVSTGYTAGLSSLAAKTMGIRGSLAEGSQEMFQRIASETAGTYYSTDVNNYYKAKIDPEAEKETLDWIKAFGTSFAKTISDDSAWEEFFIGSLTGMLGVPTFSKSGIKLENNIVSNWREAHKRRAEQIEVANKMNEIIQDPKRLNYYQSAIRRNKLQNVADAALDFNDQFTYENATHAQLISDIAMFKRAGKESDLIELVSTALDTSDENLQAIIENTTTETEDGKKVGPWIDTKGNPITNTPEGKKEMVDVITKNRENYLSLIKEYGESLDNIEAYTRGRLDEDQLEELAWMDTQLSNWEKRSNSMSQEVSDVIGKIGSWYRTRIETVSKAKDKEGASHKDRTALYDKLEDTLNKLNARYEDINTITSMSPEARTATLSSPTNRALVDDYIDLINSVDESVMSTMEKTEAVTKLRDLQRLGEASEIFSKKLNEYLTDPSKQQEAHKKAVEETAAAIEEAKKGTIKENLSKAKTVKELREAVAKEENQELANSVVQTLMGDGNEVAKNYFEISQYDKDLRKAVEESAGDEQSKRDALKLWESQLELAENANMVANDKSVAINNSDAFMVEAGGDVDIANDRFQKARFVLQGAMLKVNNNVSAKEGLAKSQPAPAQKGIPGTGVDKDTTGDSGTPTVASTSQAPTSIAPEANGDYSSEEVLEEIKSFNEDSKDWKESEKDTKGKKKYYRPAIPELHIEASKEGDFRPFDEVVAEREKGVDFSAIYNYLRDNGAFDYVNSAKLKPEDTVGFMIDPEFNDHTIFIVDTRNNQIIGSLDEGSSINKFEGLAELSKKIRDEYQATRQVSTTTIQTSDLYNQVEKETSKKDGITTTKFKGIKVTRQSGRKGYNPVTIPLSVVDTSYLAEEYQDNPEQISKVILNEVRESEDGNSYSGEVTIVTIDGERVRQEVKFTSSPIKEISLYEEMPQTPNTTSTDKFYATPTTKVSQIMIGKIPYSKEERSLNDIPGVIDDKNTPLFGIVKNGTLTTNDKEDDRKIFKPSSMIEKEGRLYILIPNSRGLYSPAAVRVRHLNPLEFNLNDATVASTLVGESILEAIDKLVEASSQDEVNEAYNALASEVYLGKGAPSERDINITWFEGSKGSGIVIGRKIKKDDGTYEMVTIDGKERKKEEHTSIYFTGKTTVEAGDFEYNSIEAAKEAGFEEKDLKITREEKDPEVIKKEIINALLKLNRPLQVAANRINDPAYNKRLITSNVLTSNLNEAAVRGSWFTLNYIDNSGNEQPAENPVGPKTPPTPKSNPPASPGAASDGFKGTPVSIGAQAYYVDTKKGVYKDSKGYSYKSDGDNANIFAMAWAQEQFGNATEGVRMTGNKVVLPDGRVLDRNTGQWIGGEEAQMVKDIVSGKTAEETNTRIARANNIIEEIKINQWKVDKDRTDDEAYYILEDDNQYHKYLRIHTLLGDNAILSKETEQTLKEIRETLLQLSSDYTKYDKYLSQIEEKYRVDLSSYKSKSDPKTRSTIVTIVRDKLTGTNSKRSLEAGSAIDTVVRDFFNGSTVVRPDNLSEEAFNSLIAKLKEVKARIDESGEVFMANNIVLFHKYPDGTRVAGEVDILSKTKDGYFKIYDIKTSKYSFYTFEDRNHNKVNYFENKPDFLKMSNKEYYTLQLSGYSNLFSSQYGTSVSALAIMPFVLGYDNSGKVIKLIPEAGIPITYNPSVSVPIDTPKIPIQPAKKESVESMPQPTPIPTQQKSLAIFNPSNDVWITNSTQDRAIPINAFDEGGEVGYYELNDVVYKGYLKEVGKIDTTDSEGNNISIPIHATKIRDRGFGREGEVGGTSEYYAVFPNGVAIRIVAIGYSDGEAIPIVMQRLSANPTRVVTESSKQTKLSSLEEVSTQEQSPNIQEKPVISSTNTENIPTTPEASVTPTSKEEPTADISNITSKLQSINNRSNIKTRRRLREVKSSPLTIWNKEKELAWLNRALPQLSKEERIKIRKGLIRVADMGATAWGMFDKGMVTLSDVAAEGTAYHEAFHVVFNMLLTQEEQESLFNEARELYGDKSLLDLEEDMAEAFREYMMLQDKRSLGRKLLDFFKNLFAKATNWKNIKPTMNNYFRMINQGRYSKMNLNSTSSSMFKLEDYTPEMQSIKEKAIANGTFMKAPNGNPTNLNERQWLQVRTKNFINWFGDWINNPSEASKVVDENGEPLVVYHYSNDDITTFSVDFDNYFSKTGGTKRAIFFTLDNVEPGSEDNFLTSRKYKLPVFLNIKDISEYHGTKEDLHKKGTTYRQVVNDSAEINNINGGLVFKGFDDNKKFNQTIYVVHNPNQIKSATSNTGEFSTTNNDIRYRLANENAEKMRREVQRFFDNFSITLKEVEEFGGEEKLFDALNRIINYKDSNDISEGVGEAIAFMMQHNSTMKDLIRYKLMSESVTGAKSIRRAFNKRGDIDKLPSIGDLNPEVRAELLKEIGQEVASELRKLYNIEPINVEPKTFLSKLWELITQFFEKLTPDAKIKFNVIKNYTKNIATSIALNDPSIIRTSDNKPGTDAVAVRVDIAKALRENPYEREIIEFLNSKNIALAGSASIALEGTLYRPEENPLHDIDFNAANYTREEINTLVMENFPNAKFIREIIDGTDKVTETYITMDREFTTKTIMIKVKEKDKEKEKEATGLYDSNGELFGYYLGSELTLKEGVKGKFLDFFLGKGNNIWEPRVHNINGKPLLIANPKNAFNAKVNWARPKDIWDYNRYNPNEDFETLEELRAQEKAEIKDKLKNARIIWGHPAIGKTTYLERNQDILEWDQEVNEKRDRFIRGQIDPEHKLDIESEEYKNLKREYMANWKYNPEYREFLTREWEALKRRAIKEGKRIFASPNPLLEIGADDFDLIVNLPEKTFLERNKQRGGKHSSSMDWKQAVNENLIRLDPSKIITTDKYFSEFMRENLGVQWGTLTNSELETLENKGWTQEKFDRLSQKERDNVINCIAF